jgi:hypothetical protein
MQKQTKETMLAAALFSILGIVDIAILDGYSQWESLGCTIFIGSVYMLLPQLNFWATAFAGLAAYLTYWTAIAFTVKMAGFQ